MTDLPDQIGNYPILDLLGRGSQAVVYKAEDPDLPREIALKVLDVSGSRLGTSDSLLREAGILASLDSHPNIATIYRISDPGEDPIWIAMEYLPSTFQRHVRDDFLSNGQNTVSEKDAVSIALSISSALGYAHSQGIFHRDLKPDNILVDGFGNIKIVDFGLAKVTTDTTIVGEGVFAGNALYAAPEQTRGELVDGRMDIYSVGIILYELLNGDVPFSEIEDIDTLIRLKQGGEPVPELPGHLDISDALREIVGRAVQSVPDLRYQSIDELIADLNKLSSITNSRDLEQSESANQNSQQGANDSIIRKISDRLESVSDKVDSIPGMQNRLHKKTRLQVLWGMTWSLVSVSIILIGVLTFLLVDGPDIWERVMGNEGAVVSVAQSVPAQAVTIAPTAVKEKSVGSSIKPTAVIISEEQTYDLVKTPVPTSKVKSFNQSEVTESISLDSDTLVVSTGGDIIIDIPAGSTSGEYTAKIRELPENMVEDFPDQFTKIHRIVNLTLEGDISSGGKIFRAEEFRFENTIRFNFGIDDSYDPGSGVAVKIAHLRNGDWYLLQTLKYADHPIMFANTDRIGVFAVVDVR